MTECGLPPEYCEFGNKKDAFEECKKALKDSHPALFDQLYPDIQEEEKETKESNAPKKGGKKVGFTAEVDKKIRVIKLHRGGKKLISTVIGLDKHGCDLTEVARMMSKKFGTGAAAMMTTHRGID